MSPEHPPSTTPATPSRRAILGLLVLLGLNARPPLTSLAPLLRDLPLPPWATPIVAALPALALSLGAYATGWLHHRWTPATLIRRALLLNTAALTARLADDAVVLVLATAASAAAIATLAAVVPALIRATPPAHAGALSSAYGITIGIGATAGAAATPLVAHAHSWQTAAAMWAALPAITAVILACITTTGPIPARDGVTFRCGRPALDTPGTRTPRLLIAYFGTVCATTMSLMTWTPSILREAEHTPSQIAGYSALALLAGIPASATVPRIAHRVRTQTTVALPLIAATATGITGLQLAPTHYTTLWMVLVGIGFGSFIHALTMISLRSPNAHVATAWSSTVQGNGYLLAATAVVGCGLLGSHTG